KELIALFEEAGEIPPGLSDQQRITDALILIGILIENKAEQILIHWEQQTEKEKDFEKRMFHCFCGIHFKFRKPVFPVAMFTDSAKWRIPVKDTYRLDLFGYPICDFSYRLIKLKHIPAEEFEKKIPENPLAAAYLPLTGYPKKERPVIKAKALNGISSVPQGPKRSVLYSLIDQSLQLNPEEEKTFRELIQKNPMFQEVKMLQSIEEVGIEKGVERGIGIGVEKGIGIGVEKGIGIGVEKTAVNLLLSRLLNKEQISEITGLDREKLDELEKKLNTGKE
ncbi:MAG: hypothetical protein V2I97_12075, partial [Desulfococcaceae bacterium]|nr:hypothetical protein [Desulfococcaceae bacterium]